MPLPDTDEILDMHRVLEPTMDEADVKTRLRRWGPVPRWVLFNIGTEEQNDRWTSVLNSTPSDAAAAAGELLGGGDGSRRETALHHIMVERALGQVDDLDTPIDNRSLLFYRRGDCLVPTNEIKSAVRSRLELAIKRLASELAAVSSHAPAFASFSGRTFECIAVRRLALGGAFPVRKLVDRKAAPESAQDFEPWTLARQPIVRWTKDSELATLRDEKALLLPAQPNKPSVDGLLWVEQRNQFVYLNATVSKTHAINDRRLADIVRSLEKTTAARIAFVWVVPHDHAHDWKVEQLSDPSARDSALRARLDQYVLDAGPWDVIRTLEDVTTEASASDPAGAT
jgi:hypothetical protein